MNRTFLVVRVGKRLVALAHEQVVETMRPLSRQRIAGAPDFVLGISIIRGRPTPIVDVARFFAEPTEGATRLVTLRVGHGRSVALLVDAVLGLREMPNTSETPLPPLLQEARAGVLQELRALDNELVVVLEAGGLIPAQVWDKLQPQEGQL